MPEKEIESWLLDVQQRLEVSRVGHVSGNMDGPLRNLARHMANDIWQRWKVEIEPSDGLPPNYPKV